MTLLFKRATLARVILFFTPLVIAPAIHAEAAPINPALEAANRATRLIESSMQQVNPKVPCASCHHAMLPLWTLGIARDHGVTINETLRRQTAVRTYGALRNLDAAIQGTHVVDQNIDVAEALAFGRELGVATDNLSAALYARRLVNLQQADGRWKTMDARPPQSYSYFMVTAMAAKTVLSFLPDSQPAKQASLEKARQWLASTAPVSTEDATFRVLGLLWLGASHDATEAAVKELAARQNADGGFAPMPGRDTDAYSTGTALFALQSSGIASDKAYRRGVEYLLRTQLPDGSWHVKTRLHEVAHISPPKMDTGFPHGADQIMSMYGTTWAVAALSLGMPENRHPVMAMPEVNPDAAEWVRTVAFGTDEQVKSVNPNAATPNGSTALMVAADDPVRAAKLITLGADPKATAKSGQNAVSVAAGYAGTAPLIRRLLEAGVPAKLGPKAEFHANPLVEVAWTGDLEVAKALLDAGADMNQMMLREGVIPMTPLKAAVALNAAPILREFLRRGADPNTVDEIPMLSWAAAGNRPDSVRVLLEAGANPELKDQYGWTPLMHARGVDHDVDQTSELIKSAIQNRSLRNQ